jgi:hypothetical protein
MLWVRMLTVAFRLTWPYLFTPWRSPMLRWRLETFGVRGDIGPVEFFQFCFRYRIALLRFLWWAARL